MDKRTAQIFMTVLLHHETKDSEIFFFPVLKDFLGVFSLWEEEKKEGNQGFQGALCSAETVSQKLVFDALNYMIVTCSLILHVCHV